MERHTRFRHRGGLLAAIASCALWHMAANAAFVTFDDKASFLAATGATSATGPLPNLGRIPPGDVTASQTVGDVTFTISSPSTALFFGRAGLSAPAEWTTLLPGQAIAISNAENLNADLAGPVFALGFDFVEPSATSCFFAVCTDSTFTVTLKSGGSILHAFNFNAADDVAAFVGVWSSASFDRVEIRDITGTLDDEFFGEFYTGFTPVPIPAALPLVTWTLSLMVGAHWTYRRNARVVTR